MKKLDLNGKVFGRLTVISRAEPAISPKGYKSSRWNCICECGNTSTPYQSSLVKGAVKSCGCLNLEAVKERNHKHGHSSRNNRSKEYSAWKNMKNRCYNPKDKHYKDYGGRGITVCDEWRNSFEQFYSDMGKAPSKKHSLDRIDDEYGNYEPSNCRWTISVVQSINQRIRSTNTSGFKGVNWQKSRNCWVAKIGVDGKSIYLGCFEDKSLAIKARKEAEAKYHQPLLEVV